MTNFTRSLKVKNWVRELLLIPPKKVSKGILFYKKKSRSYMDQSPPEVVTPFHPSIMGLSRRFFDKYHPDKDNVILDLGSGRCNLSSYLQAKYSTYTCALDISFVALKSADGFMNYYNVERSKFYRICASATQLPFKDNSFDMVFGSGVLHHFSHPSVVLKEVKRVLKPGSRAVFSNESVAPLFGRPTNISSIEDKPRSVPGWKLQIEKSGLKLIYLGEPDDLYFRIRKIIPHSPELRIFLRLITTYRLIFGGGTWFSMVLEKQK